MNYICQTCSALLEIPAFITVGWRWTCQGVDGHLIEFHLESNQNAERQRLHSWLK